MNNVLNFFLMIFLCVSLNYAQDAKEIVAKANELIRANSSYAESIRSRSWNNLPILREWHTRKGNLSELDFHTRYWNTVLICPGGGDYVWNDDYQTVESTVFGHPGQPRLPEDSKTPLSEIKQAQFGITFEERRPAGKNEN